MKKTLVLLLSVLLAFAVVGCNSDIKPEYTVDVDGKEIITEDSAMKAAANKVELGFDQVKYTSVVYGTSESGNKYDVSFIHDGFEYSATVDAENGNVENIDKVEITGIVTEDEALNAVLEFMSVAKEDLVDLEIELDKENGVYVYEIEFDYGDKEGEYNVDATTGEIIVELTNSENADSDDDDDIDDDDDNDDDDIDDESDDEDDDIDDESDDEDDIDDESDDDDDEDYVSKPSEEVSSGLISEKNAFDIAIQHAGVDENGIEKLQIDLRNKKGSYKYEVEFVFGYAEYDYDIDALTGEILAFDKDAESCDAPDFSQPSNEEYIGEEAALNAAFAHAGVNREDVSDVEIELDEGKGVFKYEIEFQFDGSEYEYDINALDGSVIKFNQEIDD